MDYVLGGALGSLLSFVFAIPAIFLETKKHSASHDAPMVVELHRVFGRTLKHREAFLIGLLIHVITGFLFGFVYVLFVKHEWLFITHEPYTPFSLFFYTISSWLFIGMILYPALGMGFFARKEGSHVWLETIVSQLILGLCFWFSVQFYQPSFFV